MRGECAAATKNKLDVQLSPPRPALPQNPQEIASCLTRLGDQSFFPKLAKIWLKSAFCPVNSVSEAKDDYAFAAFIASEGVRMKATIIVAAFAAVFTFTPALAAQNLVTNGGFESGDFSGWSQFGDTGSSGVYGKGVGLPVADGRFSAAFGPHTGLGGITQTIDTVPGGNYNVSFELANTDIEANNQFIFSFGDGFQVVTAPLGQFGFQDISVPVTASGLSADVSFFFYNPTALFLLDDVSVTPVPEPASWSMLLAGFVAIGAALRRRKLLTA